LTVPGATLPNADAPGEQTVLRFCSYGFACDNELWFAVHLQDNPDHRERIIMRFVYADTASLN
jgi:hypothetical protein